LRECRKLALLFYFCLEAVSNKNETAKSAKKIQPKQYKKIY
jgi:hypothetical protein